eukprot:2817454-Lingulodinium_polyedra.AAC.1
MAACRVEFEGSLAGTHAPRREARLCIDGLQGRGIATIHFLPELHDADAREELLESPDELLQ